MNLESPANEYRSRFRLTQFEPWLLGLAGFLLTVAGLLVADDGTTASRLGTVVSTAEGLAGLLR